MRKRTRRTLLLLLAMLIATRAANAIARRQSSDGKPSVEITEVKDVGVSASDDAKSIVEVQWTARERSGVKFKSFHVELEINYADGATEKTNKTVKGSDRFARFEMPTLHVYPGKLGAEMRGYKAALQTETGDGSTKQGRFK